MSMFDFDKRDRDMQAAAEKNERDTQEHAAAQQIIDEIKHGDQLPVDFDPVTEETAQREDKLFTQGEVNHFIKDRLSKYRVKATQSTSEQAQKLDEIMKNLEQREKDLKKRELRHIAITTLKNQGIPADETTLAMVIGADEFETQERVLQFVESLFYAVGEETPEEREEKRNVDPAWGIVEKQSPIRTSRKVSLDKAIRNAMKL